MDKKILKKYLVGDFTVRRLLRSAAFICKCLLVYAAFIYVCLLVFAWVWSDRLLFQPQPCTYGDADGIIKIEMDDGPPISAIYLASPASGHTVLYNHGNAVDLGDIRGFLTKYRQQGFSVLSYDYRGYGTSSGRPTTANACKSADAALKYLVEQRGIPVDRIIVHGRSVGGGPALYLAHANDVAGVIVESSFVTAFRVQTHIPLTPFDKFRNIARIAEVNCPVLVIHGRADGTIPLWHGEKLFKKAKEPKMSCWLDEATHNYMPMKAEVAYWAAIASFSELVDSRRAVAEYVLGPQSPESEQGAESDAITRALARTLDHR